jgi:predicted DNA-binding protein
VQYTILLHRKSLEKLEEISKKTGKPMTELIKEALAQYLAGFESLSKEVFSQEELAMRNK